MRRRLLVLLALAVTAAASCSGGGAPHDESVRVDQIQVLGTHNSYRRKPPPALFDALMSFDRELAESLDYEHRPLTEQLSDLGARQLELDVFADPEGGLYSTRHINPTFGLPDAAAGLEKPGFKVFHVQEIDYESTCPTFVACLTEVREWSDANPYHLPLLILVEAKDSEIPDPLDVGFVTPVKIDALLLQVLDDEIRSVFEEGHVITPASRGDQWPTLDESRGKVIFALDNTNEIRDEYLTLDERLMFSHDDGAFLKLNDPIADEERIRHAVADGYVVRTRADADAVQARSGDTDMRDAALASGAQYISTDYLEPDERFGDYVVRLPAGAVARCNRVSAPDECDDEVLAAG